MYGKGVRKMRACWSINGCTNKVRRRLRNDTRDEA